MCERTVTRNNIEKMKENTYTFFFKIMYVKISKLLLLPLREETIEKSQFKNFLNEQSCTELSIKSVRIMRWRLLKAVLSLKSWLASVPLVKF